MVLLWKKGEREVSGRHVSLGKRLGEGRLKSCFAFFASKHKHGHFNSISAGKRPTEERLAVLAENGDSQPARTSRGARPESRRFSRCGGRRSSVCHVRPAALLAAN